MQPTNQQTLALAELNTRAREIFRQIVDAYLVSGAPVGSRTLLEIGIGTVIGHEITHGFDDQGRQYDAQGNLTDWWTPESAAKFKQRAAIVVKQFAGYSALPGLNVNGELTLGEDIGTHFTCFTSTKVQILT